MGNTPTDQDRFNFLRRLTPIAPSTPVDGKDAKHPFFVITVEETGEPYLKAVNADSNVLTAGERALKRELERLKAMEEPWGLDYTDTIIRGYSMWKNPQLAGMIQGVELRLAPYCKRVDFSDSKASIQLIADYSVDARNVTPKIALSVDGQLSTDFTMLSDSLVLYGEEIYPIDPVGENFVHIKEMAGEIPVGGLEMYLSLFLSYFSGVTPVVNGKVARFAPGAEEAAPTIFLEKVAQDKALYLRVGSTLGSLPEGMGSDLPISRVANIDEGGQVTVRGVVTVDHESLADNLERVILQSAPSRQAKKDVFRDGAFFIVPEDTAGPFLLYHLAEILRDFRLVGSDKLREYKISSALPKLKLKLSSGIDFLEGDAQVEIGSEKFSIGDLLAQFSKQRYVKLSDGNRAILDEKYIGRLQRIFNRRNSKGKIKLSFFDLPEVENLINEKIKGDFATRTRKVFAGFNSLAKNSAPKLAVKAKLRKYQKEGVKWIKYLYDNNLGGCLADDMGLGKTLQTISILSLLYPSKEGEERKPSLIVMPRSLLFNWENEFAKFAPDIRVATYYGPDRNLEESLKSDVVLTTYAIARNDIETLKDVQFEYVILDESQNIKNVTSQTAQAATLLDARHRLALSGTPMENNLTEIYSLFRFLNPTMFGSFDEFNAAYTYPIQKNGDKEATESLRRRIYPFILRRLKRDVLTELPERIDRTLYVEMNDRQRKYYEERRIAYKEEIERSIKKDGVAKSQFVMFQALNELRRIASVPESLTDGRIKSPKIDDLIENLEDAAANGHKSVVFFNYIAGLELVGDRLQQLGIEFETMSGSTTAPARKKIVERFQNDPTCQVLLMTLKVGGVGLNLTAADTVFIFEPWWNKAAEEQAINRLHRIGQKSVVVSSSIITEGTIEEKILQLQEKKKELIDALISDDQSTSKHLSEEDINFILS